MSDETKAEASQVREGQRIAKVMARAGICSRRDAEAWIEAGRVTLNGAPVAYRLVTTHRGAARA